MRQVDPTAHFTHGMLTALRKLKELKHMHAGLGLYKRPRADFIINSFKIHPV